MFKRLIISKTVRRRVSWTVAVVLILPFILFFHATGRSPAKGPGGSAGVMFGKRIPWETFQEQRRWILAQFKNQMGELPTTMDPLVAQYTWDRLILLEEAKRRGLQVEDQEVATFIRKIPDFQANGQFSSERYDRLLTLNSTSPQRFETQVREELLITQLINAVKSSVTVTEEEVKAAYLKSHEHLKASIIVFDPASFAQAASTAIADEAIRAEYAAHPEAVRIPERITVEYAGASREALTSHVTLSEENITSFYQDHPEAFTKPDGSVKPLTEVRTLVRQYATNERVRKQLTALALDLEDDVAAKLRFEEIVKTRALTSHTVGPFAPAGDQLPQEMPPALLQAVDTLPQGRVSDVVRTDDGVSIARVTQRLSAHIPPLEEVRTQIRNRLITQRARELAKTKATALQTYVKERRAKGFRFEEAALTYGVLPAHPASFTRTDSIPPLGSVPMVNAAAFTTPLGGLTEILDTPRGFVMVRPEERLPADLSGFSSVQAALRQEALTQKQSARLEEWLAELRDQAKLESFVTSSPSES